MPYCGVRVKRDTRLIETKLHGLNIPKIDIDKLREIVDKTISMGTVKRLSNAELCTSIAQRLLEDFGDKKEVRWAECHIVDSDGTMYGSAAAEEDYNE